MYSIEFAHRSPVNKLTAKTIVNIELHCTRNVNYRINSSETRSCNIENYYR